MQASFEKWCMPHFSLNTSRVWTFEDLKHYSAWTHAQIARIVTMTFMRANRNHKWANKNARMFTETAGLHLVLRRAPFDVRPSTCSLRRAQFFGRPPHRPQAQLPLSNFCRMRQNRSTWATTIFARLLVYHLHEAQRYARYGTNSIVNDKREPITLRQTVTVLLQADVL